ncbi:MAG: tetratricopeptide repeat protein [Candidatus Heimdallarchaeota archaeon]|nr:MAG: tetratricopeptide repeat protein [Candidatus Heimdallarchaeota archaeon]
MDERLLCSLLKGKIHVKRGQFQEAQEIVTQVLHESQQYEKPLYTVDALIALAEASWRVGRLNESLKYIKQGEIILNSIDRKKEKEKKWRKGELSYQKGIIFSRKGQLNEALEALKISLKSRMEMGDKFGIGEALNSIGVTYFYMGKLNRALDSYLNSLKVKEDLGNIQQLAIAYNNIGDLFHTQGELNKAKHYYQQSLTLFEETGNKEHISNAIHNMGKFYHQTGAFNIALEYFEKALGIAKELGNQLTISENLYHLILVSIENNDLDQARDHFQYIQTIAEQEDNPISHQRQLVGEALILKTENRLESKMKALELLGHVIEGEFVNHELNIAALLHSCDLLLFELQIFGDEKVLSEIKVIADQLLVIANQEALHSLIAETYLLQSRLAMIELDLKKAHQLLVKASFIAEKRGLSKLANTILHEMDLLPKWEKIIDQQPDLKEITELTQIEDLIKRMIRKKVPRSEKEIKNYVLEAKELLEAW